VLAMIKASADRQKVILWENQEVKVVKPDELLLGFQLDRWGMAILGPEPDFKLIAKAGYATNLYYAFRKHIRERTPEDWEIISGAMKVIEGWDV